jgi:N-hydroxyarylamine O-acetyltransferase
MNVRPYLQRIGYCGPVTATADTLRELHRAHMLSVPFENLDIHCGRRIVVDPDAFVRKVVERRRGGFCYELNGAFAALLQAVGFRVTLLSARVPMADGSDGPEFDHLALRVDLDEPWLADVGFGDSFLEPLRLTPGIEQAQDGTVFRILESERLRVERLMPDGKWKFQYDFTLTPRALSEFAGMCDYHQTSPQSPFTRKTMCSLATPDGRITLSEMKLITTRNGVKSEREFAKEEERLRTLRDLFGVELEQSPVPGT